MRKIYKYPIEPKDVVQTFDLPRGTEIVSIRTQPYVEEGAVTLIRGERLFFWAIVNPKEKKMIPRRLMCVGTGWEIQPNIEDHIDTCVTSQGFAWHLLDVR
jgi:hypothetical protein